MPCHVMYSEPGLKRGHTIRLVNCCWPILGAQRVVPRPACLPLPATASGSLVDVRCLLCLGLCTVWTHWAGGVCSQGTQRKAGSLCCCPACHWPIKLIFIFPQGRSSCHFSSCSLRRTHKEMGFKAEWVYTEHLCYTSHQHTTLCTYPHTLKFILQDRCYRHQASVEAICSEMVGNFPKATQPSKDGAGI